MSASIGGENPFHVGGLRRNVGQGIDERLPLQRQHAVISPFECDGLIGFPLKPAPQTEREKWPG